MKYAVYILISFLCVVSNPASAQVFANGTRNTVPSVQENKSKTTGYDPLANKDEELKDGEEDHLLTDAVANFSGSSEQEKKYDNSRGSVIRFKIVDGEVIFEDNKDRLILVYYSDYKVTRGLDGVVRCSMRMHVLNDLEVKISNIAFKLLWPKISTRLQMQQINPGVSNYTDIMLLGDGCFTMDKTPTIEINRCRVKGMTEENCAEKVKWFAGNNF